MMPFTPISAIGDVIQEDADLTTFNNLLRRSGVIRRLDADGTFTVFAPTNAAFDLLPPGSLGAFVNDSDKLARVVAYHVTPGEYGGAELLARRSLPTLNGDRVTLVSVEDGVIVGGAVMEEADIPARNGVVHKIGNVMFPSDI